MGPVYATYLVNIHRKSVSKRKLEKFKNCISLSQFYIQLTRLYLSELEGLAQLRCFRCQRVEVEVPDPPTHHAAALVCCFNLLARSEIDSCFFGDIRHVSLAPAAKPPCAAVMLENLNICILCSLPTPSSSFPNPLSLLLVPYERTHVPNYNKFAPPSYNCPRIQFTFAAVGWPMLTFKTSPAASG